MKPADDVDARYLGLATQGAATHSRHEPSLQRGGSRELYDLTLDRGEARNLAAAQPERVERMAAAWDAWAESVKSQYGN